jgi:hypothetical protein
MWAMHSKIPVRWRVQSRDSICMVNWVTGKVGKCVRLVRSRTCTRVGYKKQISRSA